MDRNGNKGNNTGGERKKMRIRLVEISNNYVVLSGKLIPVAIARNFTGEEIEDGLHQRMGFTLPAAA